MKQGIAALALIIGICALATPASAQSRDADLAEVMKVYEQRATLKNHVNAVAEFARLSKAYPEDREIAIWCARTASYAAHRIYDSTVKKKVAGRGVKCAQRLLDRTPKDYDGRIWWLMSRLRYESTRGVVDALKAAPKFKNFIARMIRDEPTRAEGYMMLGVIYRELPGSPISFGDPAKALKMLEKADRIAPNHPEILLELALAYAKVDRVPEAAKTYKRCIAKGVTQPHLAWESQDARDYAKKMLAEL